MPEDSGREQIFEALGGGCGERLWRWEGPWPVTLRLVGSRMAWGPGKAQVAGPLPGCLEGAETGSEVLRVGGQALSARRRASGSGSRGR